MKIRISRADPDRSWLWFNDHVGEEFEVVGIFDTLPDQYVVDTRHLSSSPTDRAVVPFTHAVEVGPVPSAE